MFAMTEEFKREKLSNKTDFYCPNGHGQHYLGKTDAQRRREAEQRADEAEAKAQAAATALKRFKSETAKREALAARRAAAGVCPCCRRSFVQLARHMKSKHPDHGQS
jgi:hypothetical protein